MAARVSTDPRLAALTLLLLLSLLGNAWLYRAMREYQGRARAERADLQSGQYFAAANASLRAATPAGLRVVLAGDSDVALWDPLPQLQGVEIVNRGWGGDRTGDLLLRLERDVLELRPDMVVVTIGGNDLEDIALFPEREPQIIETCVRNVRLLVERLAEAHLPVVLLTVLPYGDVPLDQRAGWSDGTYRGVRQVNAAIRTLGRPGVSVLDCDRFLSREDGRRRPAYSRDVMHLNAEGYRTLNQALLPVLTSLMGRRTR